MQPFGTYPIHIVVRNGRTLLVGTVDRASDKTVAGFRAREVPGTFGVVNELVVPDAEPRKP
jgi:osmotically-inducible protein OsmY